MKLTTITVLTGPVRDFYSRSLWTELIKAGASFTAEIHTEEAMKNNKVVMANTLQSKLTVQDAERMMCWVHTWANTHYNTPMAVAIHTPLPKTTITKLSNMIAGSDLVEACADTHKNIIPEAK